jgi:hypothetical protein
MLIMKYVLIENRCLKSGKFKVKDITFLSSKLNGAKMILQNSLSLKKNIYKKKQKTK